MKIKDEILVPIVALAITIPLGYGGWKLSRWANWKYSYGAKVEQKIDALEKRVEVLEVKMNKHCDNIFCGGWGGDCNCFWFANPKKECRDYKADSEYGQEPENRKSNVTNEFTRCPR